MPESDPQDLELQILSEVTHVLENFKAHWEKRFEHVDVLLEALEKKDALLTTAYVELAAMVQSIIATIGSNSPEERSAFNEALMEARQHMLTLLNQAAQEVAGIDEFKPASGLNFS